MFDRSKPTDEASAFSAQGARNCFIVNCSTPAAFFSRGDCIMVTGIERQGIEGSLQKESNSRPTYDDMPFPTSPVVPRDVFLLPEEEEKEVVRSIREMPGTDSESIVKSCSPSPCRSQEGIKSISVPQTFIQKLKMGQEHILEISQQTLDICSSEKKHTVTDGAQIANSSRDGQFTAVSPVSHHLRSTPLCHSSPVSPVIAKNIRYSATSNLIPSSRYDHMQKDVCHKDGLLNTNPNPVLASVHPKNPSFSHQSPTCNQGNSSYLISGQSFFKLDGLQSQDETLVSDFCLRDLVVTSNSRSFGASPQLTRYKDIKVSRVDETSVDRIIEEVILKYCHGAPPNNLSCKDEESNSYLNISSLLDHNSLEGSEMSFNCEAPVCSGAGLPKAATNDIEFLKEVQVNLEDRNYGTQLSSVLKGGSVEQTEAATQDIIIHNEEPVLPALPHVPPSFVGKTWSQIMYEDDIKIEALVRDFKEGRFRCHFNSEPSANCTGKRMRKKQKDERKSDVTGNRTETSSVKALPEFNDAVSGGSDFDNLLASDTLCNPQILQIPRKRTWRLASRCQVVKVSHGTQTSLVNYPVVKRKIIRKESDPPDQKANIIWSENERISNMKTRLCALKLPEAYTKIMSPLQPKTVVYVLSCPEIKQYKGKSIDAPKMRRNHNSTDSKDSVRYRYKQCSLKYYDPLTNRILKTPPKSTVREKAKKPSHVRQLFRSLSLDANTKKLSDTQKEYTPSKSFNWPGFYSSSSAAFLSDPVKGNDMNSSLRTDGSSISTERSDFPVFVHSEKSYKHLVISPFNSHQSQIEGDVRLTPINSRVAKTPLKSIRSERLERENSKTMWKRKEGTSREPGFSKKASVPMSVNCGLVRRGSRVAPCKQASRTKKRKKEQIRGKLSSCAQKSSSVFSIHRHQTRKPTLGKHLKKEKLDAKKLNVRRKPRRTFLNSTIISGITEKRQKITAGSFPKKPELASSKVRSWEIRVSPAL
ncbi:DBF4-type zinc finger-containing protein 2 isoform X3 [Chelonia mydas]|uniref:DBF4-type zinc finger-containing protein 2 isoform X3 n=1 Tax=Chelonia mydas TaxID=8469 RepID=UPI0018A1F2CE|nr:DBF4-type zinc finger-containing protein 2 isoform X3 [Chelonia mydas]